MKSINDILDDFSLPTRIGYLEHVGAGSWDEVCGWFEDQGESPAQAEDTVYYDLLDWSLK